MDASNRVPLVLMGTAINPYREGSTMRMTARKPPLSWSLLVLMASSLGAATSFAQTPAPAPAPAAAPAPAEAPPPPAVPVPAPEKKKTGVGPGLLLSPDTPQVGGRVTSPAEPPPVVAPEPSAEWKFEVTGYFRAPMRFSWGPALTSPGVDEFGDPLPPSLAGTQLRTPPLVPDANYIDWRYTNSFVAPWTELNFKYGNDRVKAQVQIASYNLTDPGYRRLESNLGINQAFITLLWPEFANNESLHLTLTVGGFTNRYGAAGRYDAGKYETYLFGRTHVAGATVNLAWDVSDDLTLQIEGGGGAKLEPIPYYGAPGPSNQPRTSLPMWEPYPGPRPQESAFLAHLHLGAVLKRQWIFGAHFINVFANDNERSTAFTTQTFNTYCTPSTIATMPAVCGRPYNESRPRIMVYGLDIKQLHQWIGDGYLGFSVVDAKNAIYLGDAIEVLHSFGGWQLHDNYFGPPGGTDLVTGKIYSTLAQYSLSFGQLLWHPQAFWGQGPDLVLTVFGMFNYIDIDTAAGGNTMFDGRKKLKFGAEMTYLPLEWFGVGFRGDVVQPNLDNSNTNFSVFSPRLIFRTAFVTHEQIMIQYSRYFTGSEVEGQFPYNSQPGGGMISPSPLNNFTATDKNAAQIAAIIWF
jgi:hypothetical protein